jgi:hypothetical protein
MASTSFCAASTPWTCFSVSAICLIAGASCWAGGGAAWAGAACFGGACLACANTSPLEMADSASTRQAVVNAKAAGRMISRMEGLLDG